MAEMNLCLTEYVYKTWFQSTKAENPTESSLEIVCPSKLALDNLQKYRSLIQESVNKIAQGNYELLFKVGKVESNAARGDTKSAMNPPLFTSLQKSANKTTKLNTRESGLTPHFNFESFVTGSNNQLAYSVAWAVAQSPGKQYNPLFIYSGVGLGKTHIMQAIGNKIIQDKPNLKVVYTTSEQFTNELVEAIQSGTRNNKYTSNKFRKKFREADVLLIDDIQFIVGRESTQEEIFHTFNALHLAGKQIVLTSDRPPQDFVDLEERITSRFGSGITVDIQKPDLEMRTAILRKRRDENQDSISNEVIGFIAEKVDTNIRELEGAYLQVLLEARAKQENITVDFTAETLGQRVPDKRTIVNPNAIMNAVCKYFSISKTDIKGRRRTKEIVVPRQIAMYLLKDMTGTPLIAIGELLGGRDHTTVMHGADKIGQKIREEPRVEQDVRNIKQLIFSM